MNKAPVLSEDEKLGCSLVSRKHPYKELKATIDEACLHQVDADDAYYRPLIEHERSEYYDRGYAQAVKDSQNIIGQRECFWKAQVKDEIKQAKQETAREIFEEIEIQINNLNKHINELNAQRQPLIETMHTRHWTVEEDEFMYSSVREVIEIPNRITQLNNLKEFIKSKYLNEYCVDCNEEVAVKLEDCPKFKEEK